MRQETVHYLTEEEEEFTSLLTQIGMNRNVASVLVFLLNRGKATSREIERGTGLRQPEVSVAIGNLKQSRWVSDKDLPRPNKGRPIKVYALTKSDAEIVKQIQAKKKEEILRQNERIRHLNDYI